MPTPPDESPSALAQILPPSPAWFRSLAESKQEVLALRQQMAREVEEAKRQRGAWRMWSVLGAFGASVAVSSQYKKSTRAIAAAGTVFAMSKAYGRYNDSEKVLLSAAQNFGTAIDSLDNIFLGSGPSILAPLAWPDEDDDFLSLYVRSLDEVEAFHPVMPRKNRKAIQEILLLRASVTPTKQYERHLMRSAWKLGTAGMTEIGSVLDQLGRADAREARRTHDRLHTPYTIYSGAGLFVSGAVLWGSATAHGMPAPSLGLLAIVMTILWGWGTIKFGRALAWQAALRPAVHRARRVGARQRLARWFGALSTDPSAARFRPPERSRHGERKSATQWAVPLPRSAGPIWIAALTVLLFLSG